MASSIRANGAKEDAPYGVNRSGVPFWGAASSGGSGGRLEGGGYIDSGSGGRLEGGGYIDSGSGGRVEGGGYVAGSGEDTGGEDGGGNKRAAGGMTAKDRVLRRRDLHAALQDKLYDRQVAFRNAERGIGQDALAAARQAYVDRRVSERGALEGTAAAGLGGGAADERVGRLEQAYQDALRRIQSAQARLLAEAQQKRADAMDRDTREYQREIDKLR